MNGLKPMRCFRTRGKKGEAHPDVTDPPRRRGNNKRGHGTYANDRPPVVGTVGRDSGQCRLRVCERTTAKILRNHVQWTTSVQSICYTDEWMGYTNLERRHQQVAHGNREWARDDDGDGLREVHTNTIEGLWTTLRNFLRPFRGVHKKYLKLYVAICEHAINRKVISPDFIANLVVMHKY